MEARWTNPYWEIVEVLVKFLHNNSGERCQSEREFHSKDIKFQKRRIMIKTLIKGKDNGLFYSFFFYLIFLLF